MPGCVLTESLTDVVIWKLVTSAHVVLAVLAVVIGLAAITWSALYLARKRTWLPLAPAP